MAQRGLRQDRARCSRRGRTDTGYGGRAAEAGGREFERVGGDKVGRLILRRGEQKDPRASRPRRRKPGTRKTPPSHVHPSLLRLSSPLLAASLSDLLCTVTDRRSRRFHPPFPPLQHEERTFESKESDAVAVALLIGSQ